MQKLKPHSGFTLIEVIVVIVLLGVLAGMIVPRMGGSMQRQQSIRAANEFAQTARTVADLAVARQQQCAIDIDEDGYSAVMKSADTGEYQPLRVSWLRPRHWPDNVRVLALRTPDGVDGTGPHRLQFQPDGSSSGVLLRVGSDDESSSVSVSAGNSRARIEDAKKPASEQDQYDLGD